MYYTLLGFQNYDTDNYMPNKDYFRLTSNLPCIIYDHLISLNIYGRFDNVAIN